MWDIGRVMAIWLAAGGVSSGTTTAVAAAALCYSFRWDRRFGDEVVGLEMFDW